MMPVRKPVATNHTGGHRDRARGPDQHVCSNIMRATVRVKVWLELDGTFVIGEGGAEVLTGIATEGSLSRAAARVGWSYRHAWGYLRRAERVLGTSLATALPGKGTARGMQLTPAGVALLEQLRSVSVGVAKVSVAGPERGS